MQMIKDLTMVLDDDGLHVIKIRFKESAKIITSALVFTFTF